MILANPLPALRLTIEDVAVFNGLQETPDIAPWFGQPFEVWTLTEDIAPTMKKRFTFERSAIEKVLAA